MKMQVDSKASYLASDDICFPLRVILDTRRIIQTSVPKLGLFYSNLERGYLIHWTPETPKRVTGKRGV